MIQEILFMQNVALEPRRVSAVALGGLVRPILQYATAHQFVVI